MIYAWHFVGETLHDDRPIPADGEWLVHTGSIQICLAGLHASRRPWHALQYAPGATLCRVECDDIVTKHDDKFVCRRRRIIERADITETLWYFARMQALSVIHLYHEPLDVVLDYLMTGDESIREAARDAAWDAARTATQTATRCGARATAHAAAWHDPWAAARDAAWDAERMSAPAAAWNAVGRDFDALIYEGFGL